MLTDGKTVGIIKINGNKRLAHFECEKSKTSNSDVTVTTFDATYAPKFPVIRIAHTNKGISYVIGTDGTIKLIGTNTGTCNINNIWKY